MEQQITWLHALSGTEVETAWTPIQNEQTELHLAAPTAEQLRQLDLMFVQEQQDANFIHGLLGTWTSLNIGHAILADRQDEELPEDRARRLAEARSLADPAPSE
jgi:hypothetical protein